MLAGAVGLGFVKAGSGLGLVVTTLGVGCGAAAVVADQVEVLGSTTVELQPVRALSPRSPVAPRMRVRSVGSMFSLGC